MEPIVYPGFGKPIDCMPERENRFPTLLEDDWRASTLTIRELFMLWFTEQITNKPNWQTKVFDDTILCKWRAEVDHVDWFKAVGYHSGSPCSDAMWEYMVQELRSKSELFEETGMIPVFDASAAVIKSDVAISANLQEELKAAVTPLEQIPEAEKDFHPRSDGKVLDLVHPSLWHLVYGRTRVVPGRPVTLKNCFEEHEAGQILQEPTGDETHRETSLHKSHKKTHDLWSRRFQWLPCDVELDGFKPKIVSYINNLHPARGRSLNNVLEKIIEKTLPLWDFVYRWPKDFDRLRIPCNRVQMQCTVPDVCTTENGGRGCHKFSRPLEVGEDERPSGRYDYNLLDKDHPLVAKDSAWFHATHHFEQPEPRPYETADAITADRLRFFNFFPMNETGMREELAWPADRIQVIVKLASIHLTPEKPTYDGGSWHVEGQLNEHICATAIYYYDSENVTPSHLAFRTRANRGPLARDLSYSRDDYESINATFGIKAPGDTLQELGRVLTRQGRLLTFPNVYQHRVAPFALKDRARPGHRKILALFLVDPKIPIVSTASVPPQQAHWLAEESGNETADWPISLQEAKRTRLELMDERTAMGKDVDEAFQDDQWNFCEH